MHELSLACSVVELVEKELALHGGGSVRCIEITIGDLSGVDNDAFLFSLNMVLVFSSNRKSVAKNNIKIKKICVRLAVVAIRR